MMPFIMKKQSYWQKKLCLIHSLETKSSYKFYWQIPCSSWCNTRIIRYTGLASYTYLVGYWTLILQIPVIKSWKASILWCRIIFMNSITNIYIVDNLAWSHIFCYLNKSLLHATLTCISTCTNPQIELLISHSVWKN